MRVLDDANLQLKAGKCIIAQESIEGLGYKLSKLASPQLIQNPGALAKD